MKRKLIFGLIAMLAVSITVMFANFGVDKVYAEDTELSSNIEKLIDISDYTGDAVSVVENGEDYSIKFVLAGNSDTNKNAEAKFLQKMNLNGLKLSLRVSEGFVSDANNTFDIILTSDSADPFGDDVVNKFTVSVSEGKVAIAFGETSIKLNEGIVKFDMAFNIVEGNLKATIFDTTVTLNNIDSYNAARLSFEGIGQTIYLDDVQSNNVRVYKTEAVTEDEVTTVTYKSNSENMSVYSMVPGNYFFLSQYKILGVSYKDIELEILNGFVLEENVYVGNEAYDAESNTFEEGFEDILVKGEYNATSAGNKYFYIVIDGVVIDGATYVGGGIIVVTSDSALLLSDMDALFYNAYNADLYAYYNAKVKSLTQEENEDGEMVTVYLSSDTDYTVPSLEKYITSTYFQFSDLTKKIYYRLPGSSSFSSTSSTFSLSAEGRYDFYVLFTDFNNNKMSIDSEWKLEYDNDPTSSFKGIYGYCEVNDNDTSDDESDDIYTLKVPVFSFSVWNEQGPTVAAGSTYQDDGYVGVQYTSISKFDIGGVDTVATYTLWYQANSNSIWYDISDLDDSDFATAFNAKGEYDEDELKDLFATLGWNSSTLAFTPIEAGNYRVQCSVIDERVTAPVVAESATVIVEGEYNEVSLVSQWFKYNWTSVLFLSIAGLSLIGIIVLLFTKPAEEKENSNDGDDE